MKKLAIIFFAVIILSSDILSAILVDNAQDLYDTIQYFVNNTHQQATIELKGYDEIAQKNIGYNTGGGFTISKNITLKFNEGAMFTNAPLKAITFEGNIDAGPYQIFSSNTVVRSWNRDSGDVNSKMEKIYPQWFGANNDESINKAIRFAYQSNVNNVFLPSGTYEVEDSIVLLPGVTLQGNGNSTKIIKKDNTSGPVMTYDSTGVTQYFNYNIALRDFYISGGNSVTTYDTTVDGIKLNPLKTIDASVFENILIEKCGGWGMRVLPSDKPGAVGAKNVMQHCIFNNITIIKCGNGFQSKGFFAQTQFNTCNFEWNEDIAFQIITQDTCGAQDLSFINCTFHANGRQFRVETGSLNLDFIGCHFEDSTTANSHFYYYGQTNETPIGFYNCSFNGGNYAIDIEDNSDVKLSIFNNRFNDAYTSYIRMPSNWDKGTLIGSNNKYQTVPDSGLIENDHNLQGIYPFAGVSMMYLTEYGSGQTGLDISRVNGSTTKRKIAFIGSEQDSTGNAEGVLKLYNNVNDSSDVKVKLSSIEDSYIKEGFLGIGTDQPGTNLDIDLGPEGPVGGVYITKGAKSVAFLGSGGTSSTLEHGYLSLFHNSDTAKIVLDASASDKIDVKGNIKSTGDINASGIIIGDKRYIYNDTCQCLKWDLQ